VAETQQPTSTIRGGDERLAGFHPAVATWFAGAFPDGPTEPQARGWPAIAAGSDTLIAAPTGSGKTLAAFLVGIDQLYRAHEAGRLADETAIVYVSPLRALAADISQNLERPLAEIAALATSMGFTPPTLRVGLRTGDSTPAQRAALARRPPHLLVTTPESLYLLLTARSGRHLLGTAGTVIVDEIHAMARDKRGVHLALSLERLEHVCRVRPVRVGLSATQRPVEAVARLLVGQRDGPGGTPRCAVVDCGHQRQLDLALELPAAELEAVASTAHTADVLDRIAALVAEHPTTLVFVNTRRLAERVAFQLGERLGDDAVASHHGSLSKERRERVEASLRGGELKALVATASLELGIDIGPVDLVCQLGSPRSIATFLQRVGRANHQRHGTPKGRLFPLSRDELVECAALLAAVRTGNLDTIEPFRAPLDILTQQLVAECAVERRRTDDLFALVRRAAPYGALTREAFDAALDLAVEGVQTGRGRRGAHLHHDRVNGEVEGRRGARLVATTSGGAIPELFDYQVVADPEDQQVGTVDEHWASEASPGDVFLLGTSSWRIRRVEPGVVRVVDAQGAEPTIPFWFGESPARTTELSEEVSRLRSVIDAYLAVGEARDARRWLVEATGIPDGAARQIVAYLAATRAVLGLVPTREHLVVERFFDTTGGMQLVVHCPYGARVNRAFGLGLRKRFCVTFDFELQAAANDDAVVLSLGPQHSFALDQVVRFLRSGTAEEVVRQAVLVPPSPLFVTRWRWNLNRSLVVPRWKGGRHNPPPIQRMEADDVMAAVFPQAAACQENVAGPLEIPDHPLVTQTIADTLSEALDVAGLRALLVAVEAGEVTVSCRDTVEASPLCHELLLGKPYTFLDDGEANERRTRSVPLRRGLPVALEEVAGVDPAVVAKVRAEAAPDPRTADELCDLVSACVTLPVRAEWRGLAGMLAERGRLVEVRLGGGPRWVTVERLGEAAALFPGVFGPEVPPAADPEAAAQRAVRGVLGWSGPVNAAEIAALTALGGSTVAVAVAALEAEGSILQGRWLEVSPDAPIEWCDRRLLARIHVGSQRGRRSRVRAVEPPDLVRFLFRWQHVHPECRLQGADGVLDAVAQLQGWEAPAGAWEPGLLAARVAGYQPNWLDQVGHAGLVTWLRLTVPDFAQGDAGELAATGRSPSRTMPLALCTRADLDWLLAAWRGETAPVVPASGPLARVLRQLGPSGARFATELGPAIGLSPATIEAALQDGAARGLLTADGFWALRSLFEERRAAAAVGAAMPRARARKLRRAAASPRREPGEGRWSLVPPPWQVTEPDDLADAVAEQLLARWGVVVREVAQSETLALPWREVQWALRRLEARGVARGGRFVSGLSGEQYALPEAARLLGETARLAHDGEVFRISAADPLNLTGLLPGTSRVATGSTQPLAVCDGRYLPP
jgi:ATP-dependent Lhr-like helicase